MAARRLLPRPASDLLRPALLGLSLLLVTLAPLPFGSVEPTPLLALQLLAALLAAGVLWLGGRDAPLPRLPAVAWCGIALLAGTIVLEVLPVPAISQALRPELTTRARTELTRIEPRTAPPAAPQSASPPESIDAALRLGLYGLVFAAASALFSDARSRARLAWALTGAGVFEALYGAAEYLSGHQHIFGYAKRFYLDEATGTFINRNHYAGFLAMTLPFALALALPPERTEPERLSWRNRLAAFTRDRALLRTAAAAAAALIWAGIFLSYSRGGLLAASVATVIVAVGCARNRRIAWRLGATALIPAFVLLWLTVRAPAERWMAISSEIGHGANRLMMARTSWSLITDEPFMGYGLGTFESVFRLRTPLADRVRFDYLHNDPLQLLLEGGVVGAGAFFLLACFLLRAGRVSRSNPLRSEARFHVAAWAGIGAIAIHSCVDFPLRIPATAVLTATLAGAILAAARSARDDGRSSIALIRSIPRDKPAAFPAAGRTSGG